MTTTLENTTTSAWQQAAERIQEIRNGAMQAAETARRHGDSQGARMRADGAQAIAGWAGDALVVAASMVAAEKHAGKGGMPIPFWQRLVLGHHEAHPALSGVDVRVRAGNTRVTIGRAKMGPDGLAGVTVLTRTGLLLWQEGTAPDMGARWDSYAAQAYRLAGRHPRRLNGVTPAELVSLASKGRL